MWKIALLLVVFVLAAEAVLDKMILGTFITPDNSIPAQEDWTGVPLRIVHRFGAFCDDSWNQKIIVDEATRNWNEGRMTHFSLTLQTYPGCTTNHVSPADPNTWAIEGNWDISMESIKSKLNIFLAGPDALMGTADDRRMYIRLGHELNSNWYNWSRNSTSYKLMWKYVVPRVTPVGATKSHIQWIFEPIPWEVDAAHDFINYWPGDEYVDWLSIDGYNANSFQPWTEPWERFDAVLYKMREFRPALPVMISEVGSYSRFGQLVDRKAKWIADLYPYFAGWNVQMVLYFNTNDGPNDWAVFKADVKAPNVITGSDGVRYNVFNTYKTAVQRYAYTLTNPNTSRLMTDDEFLGRLPGYQTRPLQPRNMVIYNNGSEFNDWISSIVKDGSMSLFNTTVVRPGDQYSLSWNMTMNKVASVFFHYQHYTVYIKSYHTLQFSIYITNAPATFTIRTMVKGLQGPVATYPFTVTAANQWVQYTFPWSQLNVLSNDTKVYAFYVQSATTNTGSVYFAGVELLAGPVNWPAGWPTSTGPTPPPTRKPTATPRPTQKPTPTPKPTPTAKPTKSPTPQARK